MQKLRQIIRSLNGHEQKAFENYLQSPLFKPAKGLLPLFIKLSGEERNGSQAKKTEQATSLQASDLTKHLEHFLVLRLHDKQPLNYSMTKMQTLADHDCEKAWQYAWHDLKNTKQPRDAAFHLTMSMAIENEIAYQSGKESRKKEPDYDLLMTHLDAFYCSRKLQFCCEVLNRKSLLAAATELPFLTSLEKTSSDLLRFPAVAVYYHILHTLTESDNESHFENAKKVLYNSMDHFSPAEYASCISYLKNYCIRRIVRGNLNYEQILFGIYKSFLASPKLLRLDYLSQFEFKNIVSLGLRLKEQDWTREFIRKYSYYLSPHEKKNAVTYNTAYFHFITGNFRQAIRLLREVEFTDVVYQLDARVILLKCYYELNDLETFFYHASAFRLFLLRNRYISDFQKTMNRNLIRYLSRMLRDQYSAVKVARMKTEIAQATDVADIRWLREKAEEL